jgi:hypothetical protein
VDVTPVKLPKRSKYGAVRTVVDGISFASKAEARRYAALKIAEKAGLITGLEMQPRYPVTINGVKVFTYVADFRYWQDGKRIVEDVKGVETEAFKLKKRIVEAIFGPNFTIEIVR